MTTPAMTRGGARRRARDQRVDLGDHRARAQQQVRRFRQGSVLALAVATALLVVVGDSAVDGQGMDPGSAGRAAGGDVLGEVSQTFAASWALQTPIESFTGWLLNAFRAYYGVGDRVAVGDVFGDVFSIDILTTTVWEAGGRVRPSWHLADDPAAKAGPP